MRTIGFVTALLGILSVALLRGAAPITLNDLTVPAERLPDGCALSATPSERISGNGIRGGLWAGLRIPTNPWAGKDRSLIADIRERMDEPSLPLTDAPLFSPRELARYHLILADGIDEGYAAIYREGTSSEPVTVYGVRVAASERPDAVGNRRPPPDGKSTRVVIGQIVAVVSGRGMCFQAIADYVKSLTQ